MSEPGTRRHASPRRLRVVGGSVAALTVESLLYWSYLGGDGSFHWFTHFFAGASVALLVMTLAVLRLHRPVRAPLLWVLAGHLVAMGPDLLFVREVAHRRWMDVFVAHNVSHFMPGRNLTWYVIFLGCLAVYLSVLRRAAAGRQPSDATPGTAAAIAAAAAPWPEATTVETVEGSLRALVSALQSVRHLMIRQRSRHRHSGDRPGTVAAARRQDR